MGGDGPARGERIAKRLARAGLCSRREAERLIADRRVAVDGKTLDTPAVLVTESARITVDGKPVGAPERTRLWRYHKPRGVLTAERDPQGRPMIFEQLPTGLPRLISVGRLDFNSEGLLLLTNDGELARTLELPATGWTRRYRVRVFGKVDAARLKALEAGVRVAGVKYGPIFATLDRVRGDNAWLTVALREGKNREIRRVMEHLALTANRLIRVGFGPFELGGLAKGALKEVPGKVLAERLGDAAMPQAGTRAKAARRGSHKSRQPATPAARKARPRAGKGAHRRR